MNERFTMQPRRWYGAEFIGDEYGGDPWSLSPIRVDALTPQGSGEMLFLLSFYHAGSDAGTRDKVCKLEIMERGKNYLLARHLEHQPTRLLLIHELSTAWLKDYCSMDATGDVQQWLDQNA